MWLSLSPSKHNALPRFACIWSRLDLLLGNRMQHDLVDCLLGIARISLAPIITNSICKNATIPVERRAGNGAANIRIPFQSVLCVLVPEMECAVASSSAESAVDRVE